MPSTYWIKLYLEILDDPKVGRLSDWLWRRMIESFLLSGEYQRDGELPPVPQMAWRLRLSKEKVEESLRALREVGVVHEIEPGRWMVTHFKERQEPVPGSERVRQTDQLPGSGRE